MATTILGKVACTPKGAWSSGTSYEVLDIVSNAGSSYIARQSVPAGTALSDTDYWLPVAVKGDPGTPGTDGVSPTVTVTAITGGHEVAVTDKNGTQTFDVMDGVGDVQSDGVYPDLIAGGVMSERYVTEETPYLFRVSGGGVDVGKAESDTIVGGSVVENQIVPDIGELTATASKAFTSGDSIVAGHKYLFTSTITGADNTVAIYARANGANVRLGLLTASVQSVLFSASESATSTGTTTQSDGNMWIYCYVPSGSVKDVMLIDLTQKFGSTVADYLYALGSANAIALLRKLGYIDDTYHAYNAGELKHVSGLSAHVTRGFNQWDEVWELGKINATTGANNSSTEQIRSKNYIPVLPNKEYYFHVGSITGSGQNWMSRFYDADKNYIGTGGTLLYNSTFTTPSNAHYCRFVLQIAYGVTYKNDVCINLSSDRNGQYEPYIKHTYPLDSTLTLRGIPKLDASNNLYYDGDEYASDGTVIRNFAVKTITGDDIANVTTTSAGIKVATGTLAISGRDNVTKICTGGYVPSNSGTVDMSIRTGGYNLYVYNNAFTDLDTAKSMLNANPVTIVYQAATPTTEQADPFEEYQHVNKGGTEEYVTTGIVPVGHSTKYFGDIGGKVDAMPDELFYTESGLKATRAYTVNQLIVINGQLYKANTSIASGATLTVGTNIIATSLGDIITALLNA